MLCDIDVFGRKKKNGKIIFFVFFYSTFCIILNDYEKKVKNIYVFILNVHMKGRISSN